MERSPWRPVIRLAGPLLMLQPVAAAITLMLAASRGLGAVLIAIAFIPVALLGAHVGFGMLTVRPWTRARMAVWAPLHVALLPGSDWVSAKSVPEGMFVAAVLGLILFGLYKVMGRSSEWAA